MGTTQKTGALGEELVVMFLMKRGYQILHRNFWKPWGELDVVAQKDGVVHFVEVKSLSSHFNVSDETISREKVVNAKKEDVLLEVSRSVYLKDRLRPEDNVNAHKIKRLGRIIQTYLLAEHVSSETKWQFDLATVLLDKEKKKAKINLIEDLIL